MDAMVYWFSGTGNSWLVASRIASGLEAAGVGARLVAIEDVPKRRWRLAATRDWDADDEDGAQALAADGLDVICFPVFAFSSPACVDRFLSRLPVAIGRKAAVVATMGLGGYEGRALARASRRLKENGRKVVLTEAIEMPEAFVQAYPATEPAKAEEGTARGLSVADRITSDLLAGKESLRPGKASGMALSWIASAAFGLLGRRLLGLTWSASPACTGCGLCAASCPSRTIRMSLRRPRWGLSCEDCQRCANRCPVGAVRISLPRLVLIVAPVFLPYGRWFVPLLGLEGGGFRFLVWLVGALAGTAIMAALLWVLDFLPFMSGPLSASYAGGFRRRLAPGFAKELDERKKRRA
jgi:ferredoxin